MTPYALIANAATDHNHSTLYAPIGHNHDLVYAPISHTHDTLYYTKTVGDAKYALKTDLVAPLDLTPYALISNVNTKAQSNSLYAPISHTHDSLYAPLGHNHDLVYAPISHTHDTTYYTKTLGDARYVQKTDPAPVPDLSAYALQTGVYTKAESDAKYGVGIQTGYRTVFYQTVATLTLSTESFLGKMLVWNPAANATLTISYSPAINTFPVSTQEDVDAYTSDDSYLPWELEIYNRSTAFLITVVPPAPPNTPIGNRTTVTTYSRNNLRNISAGGSAILKMIRRTNTVNVYDEYVQTLEYLLIGSLEA